MRRAATWPCNAAWSRGTPWPTPWPESRRWPRSCIPGPAGVQILPGTRELVRWHETAEHAWNRLMTQLALLSPRPEVVVIDAGSRPDPLARQLWQAADRVLLVTTVETAAIMDAYASIKLLTDPARPASIALVVNRVAHGIDGRRGAAAAGPCLPPVPGLVLAKRGPCAGRRRRAASRRARRALGAGNAGMPGQPALAASGPGLGKSPRRAASPRRRT